MKRKDMETMTRNSDLIQSFVTRFKEELALPSGPVLHQIANNLTRICCRKCSEQFYKGKSKCSYCNNELVEKPAPVEENTIEQLVK